ncbi:hypothetical protein BGW80DRAFT_1565253 [Lactifluus volemus]|nr:hypothetical protein BGW80DRAFT_1565253 [Lactifluus volemus]
MRFMNTILALSFAALALAAPTPQGGPTSPTSPLTDLLDNLGTVLRDLLGGGKLNDAHEDPQIYIVQA